MQFCHNFCVNGIFISHLDSTLESDAELVKGRIPVVNGHCPFWGDVFQGRAEQFHRSLIRWIQRTGAPWRDLPVRVAGIPESGAKNAEGFTS